jgi:signal transduction histidine kinase
VVTSGLSLAALWRAFAITEGHRIERAHETVNAELDYLAGRAPQGGPIPSPPSITWVGLRGGWIRGPQSVRALRDLPAAWRPELRRAAVACTAQRQPFISDTTLEEDTLVLAAKPTAAGFCAWSAFLIRPAPFLQLWRWITIALCVATGLLVASALWGAFAFQRDRKALQATLVALGKDLNAPVPTPRITGLSTIASGIQRMALDLRASREATEALQRELSQKERLAALGRVVAGVAHEVRNPLASIKLRLDLTATTGDLPEPARRAIDAASAEIARVDNLVNDLLLLAGKKMGPRHPVEMGALLRARSDALAPWAASRNVILHAEGEAIAEADPASVVRAVDNVLRNAIEASPAGAVVQARVALSNGSVEVSVEDRGPGVEPARVGELFEPFFTTKSDGTGLGLAISRAIARAHGGDLTYARAHDVTRFSLWLPRRGAVLGSAA